MTNLVDGFIRFSGQLPVLTQRVFLEEETDLVSGRQEIVVPDVIVVTGSELGLYHASLSENECSNLDGMCLPGGGPRY